MIRRLYVLSAVAAFLKHRNLADRLARTPVKIQLARVQSVADNSNVLSAVAAFFELGDSPDRLARAPEETVSPGGERE